MVHEQGNHRIEVVKQAWPRVKAIVALTSTFALPCLGEMLALSTGVMNPYDYATIFTERFKFTQTDIFAMTGMFLPQTIAGSVITVMMFRNGLKLNNFIQTCQSLDHPHSLTAGKYPV